jgi:hypothetical protein
MRGIPMADVQKYFRVFLSCLLLVALGTSFASDLGSISAQVEEQGKVVWVAFEGYVSDWFLQSKNTTLADGDIFLVIQEKFDDGVAGGIPSRLKKWMVVPGSSIRFKFRFKYGPTSFARKSTKLAGIMWCKWNGTYCEEYTTIATCEFTYTIEATSKVPIIYFCDAEYNPLPPQAALPIMDPLYIKVWSDFHPVSNYTKLGIMGSYSMQDTVFVWMTSIDKHEARFSLPSVKSLAKYGILNLADWGKLRAMIMSFGKVEAEDSIIVEPLWKN